MPPKRPLLAASAAALAVSALALVPSAHAAVIANYPDFSSTQGLTLNGNAAQSGGNIMRLTSQTPIGQRGSIWHATRINPGQSFNAEFAFKIHTQGGTFGAPGDGLAFLVQNATAGAAALGDGGGKLGYGAGSGHAAVQPSIAVEADHFSNASEGGPNPDPNNNHFGLTPNGDYRNNLKSADPGFPIFSNTANRFVWVDYNATTDVIEVFADDVNTKPATPLFTHTLDLGTAVGTAACIGFTAGTGSATAVHDLVSWKLDGTAATGACPGSSSGGSSGGTSGGTTSAGAGRRATGTRVTCNHISATARHTCFAEVGDGGPSPIVAPTGTVRFSSNEGGSFPNGPTCNLNPPNPLSPSVTFCQAEYQAPGSNTFARVTATYEGSSRHAGSSGTTGFIAAGFPPGCNPYTRQGCNGVQVDTDAVLAPVRDALGTVEVSCGVPGGARSGGPPARTAALKLRLPPGLGNCGVAFNGLGSALQNAQVSLGQAFSGAQLSDLFDSLITPREQRNPGLVGGLLGGVRRAVRTVLNSGNSPTEGQLGRVLQGVLQTYLRDAFPAFPTQILPGTQNQSAPRAQAAQRRRRRARKRTFLVTQTTATVKSGTKKRVRLKLTRRARRLVRALRRYGIGIQFRVNLQTTLVRNGVPGAVAGKKTVRVRLGPAKKRKKRKRR